MKHHKVIVQVEAQEEVDAIRIYQNTLDPNRGQRFIDAFQACLEQLKTNPSFQKRKGNFRHLMLHKLPYRVAFEVEEGTVYQVRHTSRSPQVAPAIHSGALSVIGGEGLRERGIKGTISSTLLERDNWTVGRVNFTGPITRPWIALRSNWTCLNAWPASGTRRSSSGWP
jgi:hypothetical protein